MLMSRLKRKASENASLSPSLLCVERWKSLLLKSYRKVILCMWLWLNRI